jgi:hypothetical protein
MPLNESNSQKTSPVRELEPNTRVGEVDSTINIFKQPYDYKIRLFAREVGEPPNTNREWMMDYAYHRNAAHERYQNKPKPGYFVQTAALHFFHVFIRPVWGEKSKLLYSERISIIPDDFKALFEPDSVDEIYKNIIDNSIAGKKLSDSEMQEVRLNTVSKFIEEIKVYLKNQLQKKKNTSIIEALLEKASNKDGIVEIINESQIGTSFSDKQKDSVVKSLKKIDVYIRAWFQNPPNYPQIEEAFNQVNRYQFYKGMLEELRDEYKLSDDQERMIVNFLKALSVYCKSEFITQTNKQDAAAGSGFLSHTHSDKEKSDLKKSFYKKIIDMLKPSMECSEHTENSVIEFLEEISLSPLAHFAYTVLEVKNRLQPQEAEIELISDILGIWLREYIAFSSISIKTETSNRLLKSLLERKVCAATDAPNKFEWTLHNTNLKKSDKAKAVFNAQASMQPSGELIDNVRLWRGGYSGFRYLEGPNTIAGAIIGAETASTSARCCSSQIKNLLDGKYKKVKDNKGSTQQFDYNVGHDLKTKATKPLGRFPILTVCALLDNAYALLGNPTKPIYFLDPCAGWGDRYLGHLLYHEKYPNRPKVVYYGCDPNPEMAAVYDELSKVHANGANHNIQTAPFEGAQFDKDLKFDVVLTSPPYPSFQGEAVENYSDSKDDSHHRYKTLEDWENGFLKTLVERSFELVNDNGLVIININDTEKAHGTDLDTGPIGKMIEFFAAKGAVLEKTYGLARGTKGRYEPIYIFRKPAITKELSAGVARVNQDVFPNNPEINRGCNQAEQMDLNSDDLDGTARKRRNPDDDKQLKRSRKNFDLENRNSFFATDFTEEMDTSDEILEEQERSTNFSF